MAKESAVRTRIDVKQAVALAMQAVRDLFGQEKITNLGLEEISSDEDVWRVTIGFSRPWDYPPKSGLSAFATALDPLIAGPEAIPEREYKVVKIDGSTGDLVGMEIRDL